MLRIRAGHTSWSRAEMNRCHSCGRPSTTARCHDHTRRARDDARKRRAPYAQSGLCRCGSLRDITARKCCSRCLEKAKRHWVRVGKGITARRYGVTTALLDRLQRKQKGACAICQKVEPLQVDHDHRTSKVRGLLCPACNRLLGCAGDTVTVLLQAIRYLKGKR